MAPTNESVGDLLAALDRWVPALLPEPERAARILAACHETVTNPAAPIDAEQCRGIERAAHRHSRHLLLFFEPGGSLTPTVEDLGWPPPDLRAMRRRACSVRSVERTPDGIATVRIDALDPFDIAEPFLEAAVALTRRAVGLVLDLRFNGGGDPATVAYIAGMILGAAVPLSEVHGADGITSWSSTPPSHDLCVSAGAPVAVLTSRATFSSAEALAYHVQVRGRVHVFGEQTPGAADHVTPVVLTPHVHAQLPIARVFDVSTGTGWEGTGVVPDTACEAEGAHEQAIAWIRFRLDGRLDQRVDK